jgi:hypothetical protein
MADRVVPVVMVVPLVLPLLAELREQVLRQAGEVHSMLVDLSEEMMELSRHIHTQQRM